MIDSILVEQAFKEFNGLEDEADITGREKELDDFYHRNIETLRKMQEIAYRICEQRDEPVEVGMLSAPQHLSYKLV